MTWTPEALARLQHAIDHPRADRLYDVLKQDTCLHTCRRYSTKITWPESDCDCGIVPLRDVLDGDRD